MDIDQPAAGSGDAQPAIEESSAVDPSAPSAEGAVDTSLKQTFAVTRDLDTSEHARPSIDDILANTVGAPMDVDNTDLNPSGVAASLDLLPSSAAPSADSAVDLALGLPPPDEAESQLEPVDSSSAPLSSTEIDTLLQAPVAIGAEQSSTQEAAPVPSAESSDQTTADIPAAMTEIPESVPVSEMGSLQTSLIGSSASAVAAATAALSSGTSSGLPSTAPGGAPSQEVDDNTKAALATRTTTSEAAVASSQSGVDVTAPTVEPKGDAPTPDKSLSAAPAEDEPASENVPSLPIAERLPLMDGAFGPDKTVSPGESDSFGQALSPTSHAVPAATEQTLQAQPQAEVQEPEKPTEAAAGQTESDITAARVAAEAPKLPTPPLTASSDSGQKAEGLSHDAQTQATSRESEAASQVPRAGAGGGAATAQPAKALSPTESSQGQRPSGSRANSTSATASVPAGTATGSTLVVPKASPGRITRSQSPRTPLTALPEVQDARVESAQNGEDGIQDGAIQASTNATGKGASPVAESHLDGDRHGMPFERARTATGQEPSPNGTYGPDDRLAAAGPSKPLRSGSPTQSKAGHSSSTPSTSTEAVESRSTRPDRPLSPPPPQQAQHLQQPTAASQAHARAASRPPTKQSSVGALPNPPMGSGNGPPQNQAPTVDQVRAAGLERERIERAERERREQEAQDRQRRERDEVAAQENEDRLTWLSLPSNDHPTYYSDTSEASSSRLSSPELSQHPLPYSAKGLAPWLGPQVPYSSAIDASRMAKRPRHALRTNNVHDEEASESGVLDDDGPEEYHPASHDPEAFQGRLNSTGNRGNKLKRRDGVRWIRRGKLGGWTEARGEKEVNDRVRLRMAALQRAGIQSLLKAAPYPHLSLPVPSAEERLDAALRRGHLDHGGALKPELLTSTALAPTLLRPISTPRALLSSHTLRHTFRNPHIAALSKTALDLRESEGTLGRALGRCFADMERSVLPDSMRPSDMPPDSLQMLPYNPPFLYVDTRGGPFTHRAIDADAIGADGTNLTADELNPSFERLDPLFVTSNGLPIPLGSDPNTIQPNGVPHEENDQSGLPPPAQAVLSPIQQRDVVRAALDCLHELATDSREYVERLDEVRARLAAVKRERTRVWQALRRWALDKEEETTTADEATANDASGTGEKHSSTLNEHASNQVSTARGNQRAAAKDKSTSSAANASGSTRKKARTAAS